MVQIKGGNPNSDTIMQVDQSHNAARVSLRPIDHEVGGVVGGHFSIGSMTGLMAAGIASAAEVFSLRWIGAAAPFFVLKKLIVQFSTATGFAATTVGAPVELIIGHGCTATGAGGTTLAPTNSNRMRASMQNTAFASVGAIRIASTAALTANTGQSLEAAPIASCMGADNRTLVTTPPFELFGQRDAGDHPLILVTGDSLVIRTLSPAATGTWFMAIAMSWAELAKF